MMPTVRTFEELEVWQKARQLAREIYAASRQHGFNKDFGLRDQIRKASLSAMSNIAEGFERGGAGDFHRFLVIAKGSIGEVRSQIYVACDEGYLAESEARLLLSRSNEVANLIGGLIRYLRMRLSDSTGRVHSTPRTRHP